MEGLSLCPPGPHAVLLVIPLDMAYKERHRRALLDHLGCLGENVWRHVMVLFTYGDRLGETTVEQHIEREGWPLQWVVEKCENRYHLFNNKSRDSGAQVAELLQKVEEMVAGNEEEHFSPDMSQVHLELENKFKRSEAEEIKGSYLEELNRSENEMRTQFEEEWKRREKELYKKFEESLMARLEKASVNKSQIKPMHPITLNLNEIKMYKEQRKNEEKRKVIRDVMTELAKRTGTSWDNNLPQPSSGMDSLNSSSNFRLRRKTSLELNPPSLGGSREKMRTEDTAGTESTQRRTFSSPSAYLAASSVELDSGFDSTFDSLRSLAISESQLESDGAGSSKQMQGMRESPLIKKEEQLG